MTGRDELTVEYALRQPHYRNILYLINDAQQRNKKIKFEHLKYVLVKNTTNKLPDKKIKDLSKFFAWEKPEIWITDSGKVMDVHSIIEFMINQLKDLNKQMNRVNDLSNFLKRLIELKLIEKKKSKGKKRSYYVMTIQGMFILFRHTIDAEVDIFLDYVFNKKQSFYKSAWMLDAFDAGITKLVADIFKKENTI